MSLTFYRPPKCDNPECNICKDDELVAYAEINPKVMRALTKLQVYCWGVKALAKQHERQLAKEVSP